MSSASFSPYPDHGQAQVTDVTQSTLWRHDNSHQPSIIDVPASPLAPEGAHLGPRLVRLEIESETCLRLDPVPRRPPWLTRTLYLVLIVCLLFMFYCGIQGILLALERNNHTTLKLWSGVAALPAILLLGTLIYPFFSVGARYFRFDRHTNLLTIEQPLGLRRRRRLIATYPLGDVVALQLLYRHFKAFEAGIHPAMEKVPSFEMNLVMRHTVMPRLNLAVHGDWKWMRQGGQRLAEFLEIPVLDQLCQA
jgi:hypothetical protein